VRLEPADAARIEKRAADRGVTKSQVVRGMVRYALSMLDEADGREGKGN
jgi:hypothetical protein